MKITRINPLTKLPTIIDLEISEKEMDIYLGGKLIQDSFKSLDVEGREFFLSGCLPGTFELQFQKRYIYIVNISRTERCELYYLPQNNKFLVYRIIENIVIGTYSLFFNLKETKIKLINQLSDELIFSQKVINLFEYEINSDTNFIDKIREIYHKPKMLNLLINEYSKHFCESYDIQFDNEIEKANNIWLLSTNKIQKEIDIEYFHKFKGMFERAFNGTIMFAGDTISFQEWFNENLKMLENKQV